MYKIIAKYAHLRAKIDTFVTDTKKSYRVTSFTRVMGILLQYLGINYVTVSSIREIKSP